MERTPLIFSNILNYSPKNQFFGATRRSSNANAVPAVQGEVWLLTGELNSRLKGDTINQAANHERKKSPPCLSEKTSLPQ
jgi:hypothetical protein